MYYSSTHNQVPKHKVRARVKTTDGESFYGSFFLSGDQRIKDLLCSDNLFIPFLTSENEVHIFNRKSIASVVPLELLGRSENRPVQPARAQTSPEGIVRVNFRDVRTLLAKILRPSNRATRPMQQSGFA